MHQEQIIERVLVLIPAYNAARRIGGVLDRVFGVVPRESIIVIDDGSSDDTTGVAEKRGVVVLRHERNRGKGAALRTGFSAAIERGFDAVVTLDADGQHPPELIPRLVEALAHNDVVIGARRFDPREMPLVRVFNNGVSSAMVSVFSNKLVRDSQTGFRAFRAGVLRRVRLTTSRFDAETEVLLQAGRRGFAIAHVPIPAIYSGETSSQRVVDMCRFVRVILRSLFW